MASLWYETFEGSEFDNAWDIETVGTGCTSDGDSGGPGSLPLTNSTKCYKTITTNAAGGNRAFIKEALPGDEDDVYFTGYIYVASENLANGESVIVGAIQDNADAYVVILYVNQLAGQLRLQMRYYSGGGLQ